MGASLSLTDIVKDFPGTRALDSVDFEVSRGEIHAIVGENGSGKSTLAKIISGALSPDAGSIRINDEEARFIAPIDALRRGIATVYQDVNLVPLMSVADNMTLGIERVKEGRPIDRLTQEVITRSEQVLRSLGAQFPLAAKIVELTHAERQFVQIARAISLASSVLVLDEPTEGLSEPQYQNLRRLLHDLRSIGIGIIYVSHRLQEVLDVADRISVLRDGKRIDTVPRASATRDDLIRLMIGHVPVNRQPSQRAASEADPVLTVRHLSRGRYFHDISLEVKVGEIVSLAGIPGAGKSELLRAIAGADAYDHGTVKIGGRLSPPASPRLACQIGVVLVPADRKREGLVLPASIRTNIILPEVRGLSAYGIRRRQVEMMVTQRHVEQLRIRTPNIETPVRYLSGGNQQKVLFARVIHAGAKVILLDEPTQGVDIAGKAEIHALIQAMADRGAAILIASSEMEELINISHRILVIRLGRLVGEFMASEADPEKILHLALP